MAEWRELEAGRMEQRRCSTEPLPDARGTGYGVAAIRRASNLFPGTCRIGRVGRNIMFTPGEIAVQAALKAMNRLVADHVIENYAIGGAIGASFYLPAMQTEDLDVFVFLPSASGPLITLTPVYDALKRQGGQIEGEHVRFGRWPLQILTDANALIADAIREAIDTEYDGIPTRVFTPEHLCAIALATGRSKDYARVGLFLDENEVKLEKLSALATRFGLSDRLIRILDSTKDGSK